MKISLLASGSKGNSCFVETQNHYFLIDIGMNCSYIEKKLSEINVSANKISAIFLTHTHKDHINGLAIFIKRYNPIIYLSKKMFDELKNIVHSSNYVIVDKELKIDSLNVKIINTSHDTPDSFGYIFEENNRSLVYITDTGYINVKNHNKLRDKTIYIIESNHDVNLLMNNEKYPYYLKQRILSDKGHLSNEMASDYIADFATENTKYVILAHLSEHNNTETLALKTLKQQLKNHNKKCNKILVGKQNDRTELIEI